MSEGSEYSIQPTNETFVWSWGCIYDPNTPEGVMVLGNEPTHEKFSNEWLKDVGYDGVQPIIRVDDVHKDKACHVFLFNTYDNARSFITGWGESTQTVHFAKHSLKDRFRGPVMENYESWDLENV